MMVSTTLKALVVSFSLPFIVAFQIPTKSTCNRQLTECQAFSTGDRRSFIAFGSSIAGLAISLPANADVADGNALPDGAAKFKRLLQLKNDLGGVTTRVVEHADEIDSKEWGALNDFNRILYKGGEDMKVVSKTIYDPAKKKKAEEDIKLLQKLAQAGDIPVSKQDAEGLKMILQKSTLVIDDFFELLRDVPDEI